MRVPGLYIWRVNYNYTFSSSSTEGGHYSIPHHGEVGLIATYGDSLREVEDAINEAVGCQSRLTNLNSAEFLGRSL